MSVDELFKKVDEIIEKEKRERPIRYLMSKLWLKINIKKRYYNIKNGTLNLIKWFPVIWKDRDWDEYYLLILMSKKMENMSKYHKKYGISANSDEVAKQLKYCSDLAKRLAEENYNVEYDYKLENELIEEDYEKLFSEMKKNIRDWWD